MSSHTLTSPDNGLPWLVADVGGTNARFGWARSADGPIEHVKTLPVAHYEGPAQAAADYLKQLAQDIGAEAAVPHKFAMAVATPVRGDQVKFTNSHWDFSRQALKASVNVRSLQVLNDFEALALSLPHLQPHQLNTHGGPQPLHEGTLAVLGPGTGLGVGGVTQTAHGWVALPGEGGHMTLAPTDDEESALLAWVRRSYPHVSGERLLSGIGMPLLHQAVCALAQAPQAELSTEQIVARGLSGEDAHCRRALDHFCALLGNVAGSVALVLGARSGVFIGGGIVPRLGDFFFASRFREKFEAKGRFEAYLKAIPTPVIIDTLVALRGCTAALAQEEA